MKCTLGRERPKDAARDKDTLGMGAATENVNKPICEATTGSDVGTRPTLRQELKPTQFSGRNRAEEEQADRCKWRAEAGALELKLCSSGKLVSQANYAYSSRSPVG